MSIDLGDPSLDLPAAVLYRHARIDTDAERSYRCRCGGWSGVTVPAHASHVAQQLAIAGLLRPVERTVEHRTEEWESAGGYYGWTCTCGANGKGHLDRDDRDSQAVKHLGSPDMPACGHWLRGGNGEPIRTPHLGCGACHEPTR